MKLIIRKNGKYYQIGFHDKKGRFKLVKHLGTIKRLVCKLNKYDELTNQVKNITKSVP